MNRHGQAGSKPDSNELCVCGHDRNEHRWGGYWCYRCGVGRDDCMEFRKPHENCDCTSCTENRQNRHVHGECGHECCCAIPYRERCVMCELQYLLPQGQKACRAMWDARWPNSKGDYRWEGPDTYV